MGPTLRRTFIVFLLFLPWAIDVSAALQPPAVPDAAADAAALDQTAIPALPPVIVVGEAVLPLTGQSTLPGDVLQQLPKKNSSLTETITLLPRVQIGEGQRTSENAGEILPPRISISGGRAYENYYAVDGVGINSLLDPLADNQNAIDEVPGHPQRTFVHQDLIDSVTVYDSNIPARYGRFVGGVVDARTRRPAAAPGGALNFRTTRDAWTRFHIDPETRDVFDNSKNFSRQPRFDKYDAGFELDLPLNEQSGLLGAYKKLWSRLELQHFGAWKSQDKTLESFFLKHAWTPPTPHALELSVSHTPSEEDFFIADTRDSDFTIKRGGYTASGNLSGMLPFGSYEVTTAWLESWNTRQAPSGFYTWQNTPSRNWGAQLGINRSREGGFGDIEKSEQSFQARTDVILDTVGTDRLSHVFNLGVEFSRDQAEFTRTETAYVHNTAALNSTVICAPEDPACVTGEQFFNNRNVFAPQQQTASINHVAAYLEDLIRIGPVELRPGVRVSHDDFMDNTDFAHRFAGSWDIRRNGRTVLIGGYNRYYGETLLTYKLREAIRPAVREVRSLDPVSNQLSDWTVDRTLATTLNRYSALNTPYSDEWTIGVLQKLFGGTLEVNYLERRNRDQFARERLTEDVDGAAQSFFVLNNHGSSTYESVKVVWQRQWRNHYLNLNYTYSDQLSSNESYDDTFTPEDLDQQVWFAGEAIRKDQLPRRDFFRKQAFSAIYVGRLPGGLTFTNTTRYVDGYEEIVLNRLLSAEDRLAQGIPADLDVYEPRAQPDYWIFDWRLDWRTRLYREQWLTLSLELNNVFDRTPPVAGSDSVFELGRQVWVGMNYAF